MITIVTRRKNSIGEGIICTSEPECMQQDICWISVLGSHSSNQNVCYRMFNGYMHMPAPMVPWTKRLVLLENNIIIPLVSVICHSLHKIALYKIKIHTNILNKVTVYVAAVDTIPDIHGPSI